jgi:N-Acetylglucosaminyltransferase-IV (GnT-IV) conserved region
LKLGKKKLIDFEMSMKRRKSNVVLVDRRKLWAATVIVILLNVAFVCYTLSSSSTQQRQEDADSTLSAHESDACAEQRELLAKSMSLERDKLRAQYEKRLGALEAQLAVVDFHKAAPKLNDDDGSAHLQALRQLIPEQRVSQVGPVVPDVLNSNSNSNGKRTERTASLGSDERPHESLHFLIVVPTVPRHDADGQSVDYLSETLSTLAEQLGDGEDNAFSVRIRVVVVNQTPHLAHDAFERNRALYGGRRDFEFLENRERAEDPYRGEPDPDDWNNPDDRPGSAVRQQTLDVVSVLRMAADRVPRYFMLLEDDFPLCPGALRTLLYVVQKASAYRSQWNAVRASFGGNGIVVRGELLAELADYLAAQFYERPPDHLITQWMCGHTIRWSQCSKKRVNFVFRWHLFRHIGASSSLRETGWANPPGCWHEYQDLLWAVDGFDENECPYDDLWPCSGHGIAEPSTQLDFLDVAKFTYHNFWIQVAEAGDSLDVSLQKRTLPLLFSLPHLSAAAAAIQCSQWLVLSIVAFLACL